MGFAPTVLSQVFSCARLWTLCKVAENAMAQITAKDGLGRNFSTARKAAIRLRALNWIGVMQSCTQRHTSGW